MKKYEMPEIEVIEFVTEEIMEEEGSIVIPEGDEDRLPLG